MSQGVNSGKLDPRSGNPSAGGVPAQWQIIGILE
jgi:hypothetical protein